MTEEQGQAPWTILRLLNWTTEYFHSKEIPSARLEAQLLLSHVLGITRLELYTSYDKPLTTQELTAYKKLVQRRAAREPIAYILGTKGFWKHDFMVTPATLIPRPDTEIMIEVAIERLQQKKLSQPSILDIGTGSGCLAISLAIEFPTAKVDAIDLSEAALAVAQQNAKKWDLNITFSQSDLFENIKGRSYDLILSNPPYISESEMQEVAPEIRNFEPHLALYSKENGLSHYRRILEDVGPFLKEDGLLLLEIGDNREKPLTELAKKYFLHTNTHLDLSKNPRLLELSGYQKWKN